MKNQTENGNIKLFKFFAIFIGAGLMFLVLVLLLGGVVKITWEFQEFNTVVDYYSNLKGNEYLLCVLYLGLFPLYYSYIFKN